MWARMWNYHIELCRSFIPRVLKGAVWVQNVTVINLFCNITELPNGLYQQNPSQETHRVHEAMHMRTAGLSQGIYCIWTVFSANSDCICVSMKQLNGGWKQARAELCDGCAGDTMTHNVRLNCHFYCGDGWNLEKLKKKNNRFLFWTPQRWSKCCEMTDSVVRSLSALFFHKLWRTQHIKDMWHRCKSWL